jgi:hypothetical protein
MFSAISAAYIFILKADGEAVIRGSRIGFVCFAFQDKF